MKKAQDGCIKEGDEHPKLTLLLVGRYSWLSAAPLSELMVNCFGYREAVGFSNANIEKLTLHI